MGELAEDTTADDGVTEEAAETALEGLLGFAAAEEGNSDTEPSGPPDDEPESGDEDGDGDEGEDTEDTDDADEQPEDGEKPEDKGDDEPLTGKALTEALAKLKEERQKNDKHYAAGKSKLDKGTRRLNEARQLEERVLAERKSIEGALERLQKGDTATVLGALAELTKRDGHELLKNLNLQVGSNGKVGQKGEASPEVRELQEQVKSLTELIKGNQEEAQKRQAAQEASRHEQNWRTELLDTLKGGEYKHVARKAAVDPEWVGQVCVNIARSGYDAENEVAMTHDEVLAVLEKQIAKDIEFYTGGASPADASAREATGPDTSDGEPSKTRPRAQRSARRQSAKAPTEEELFDMSPEQRIALASEHLSDDVLAAVTGRDL